MTDAREPACFVVHSLAHLRAALKAGEASLRPVIALSAPSAAAYAGPGWFPELIRQARAEFPDADLTAILDCGDRGSDVLAALKAGAENIIFTGHPEARRRLAAISGQSGASILDYRPAACDLLNARDPDFAARRYCEPPLA